MQKSHRSTPCPGRDFHHGHKNYLDETEKSTYWKGNNWWNRRHFNLKFAEATLKRKTTDSEKVFAMGINDNKSVWRTSANE